MTINPADTQTTQNLLAAMAQELLSEAANQPMPAPSVYNPQADLAAIFERVGKQPKYGVGPSDISGSLTSRLVAAQHQDSVRLVISEAYKSLGEWMKIAMGGGKEAEKAFAVIKRLNKVIRRASRKIADLNKEDVVRSKQKRAERKNEEPEARRLKAELRRRLGERKQRETRYLADAHNKPPNTTPGLKPLSLAELQAKIAALETAKTGMPSFSAAVEAAVTEAGGGAELVCEAAVTE
jgi:hypothetical protein